MAGNELVMMTWNVENLFRPALDAEPDAKDTYERKLGYLAATVRAVAPDGLAVQEVGGPDAAEDLRAAIGADWHVATSEHGDDRGIRVAILSPHEITAEADVSAYPSGALREVPDVEHGMLTRMGRGALRVRLDCAGPGLRVLTAHLKSKLLSYPGDRRFPRSENERARGAGFATLRRTAEAVALRVHLNTVMTAAAVDGQPSVPTVLCGDLNDGVDAVTTVLLEGPVDGDPHRPDKGDPVRLYNLGRMLPPARAYSRIFEGRGELIDHIMVSRDLRLRVAAVDALVDDIGSISASVRARDKAVVPDHAPVVARFTGTP
jgi:endonuclease/exonuclease/phosphatase family metal-dependent hydrolase